MATIDDLEDRLTALEARLGPAPLAVPPIVVGSISDVPAPGSPIASNWANEVSNRIVHRFATAASRDSAWPASVAGVGSVCITLDTGTLWKVINAVWVAQRTLLGISSSSPNFSSVGTGWNLIPGSTVNWTAIAGHTYKWSAVGMCRNDSPTAQNCRLAIWNNGAAIAGGDAVMGVQSTFLFMLPCLAVSNAVAAGACASALYILTSSSPMVAIQYSFAVEDLG